MSSDDLAFLNSVLGSQAAAPAPSRSDTAGGAGEVNGHSSSTGDAAAKQTPDIPSLQPLVQALKISATTEEDPANMSDEAISAMLAKLDEANLVTDGLESRLDQLLGQLDGMLENLETSSADVVEREIETSVQDIESGQVDEQDDVVNGQIVNHKLQS